MFAYCLNNPVNMVDSTGKSAVGVLGWWASTTWWLCGIDGPLPIGDIVYGIGFVIIGTVAIVKTIDNIRTITGALDEQDTEEANNNPESDKDKRLKGNPGDINTEGYRETKIGDDGRASSERHNTDHSNPKHHSNPHDHKITWDSNGKPHFGPPINYWNGEIPIFN